MWCGTINPQNNTPTSVGHNLNLLHQGMRTVSYRCGAPVIAFEMATSKRCCFFIIVFPVALAAARAVQSENPHDGGFRGHMV